MKAIVIVLGLTASQIQQRSSVNLGVSTLYDTDARHLRGPLTVRYETTDGNILIEWPVSSLASLSFIGGTLISATINPHAKPLSARETVELCFVLEERFRRSGFALLSANELRAFSEQLSAGQLPQNSVPPWRFGVASGDNSVNMVVRSFESSSRSNQPPQYIVALEFGNAKVDETAYQRMRTIRSTVFPNRRGRIPLAEYPR